MDCNYAYGVYINCHIALIEMLFFMAQSQESLRSGVLKWIVVVLFVLNYSLAFFEPLIMLETIPLLFVISAKSTPPICSTINASK
jgi:hypothetical protein